MRLSSTLQRASRIREVRSATMPTRSAPKAVSSAWFFMGALQELRDAEALLAGRHPPAGAAQVPALADQLPPGLGELLQIPGLRQVAQVLLVTGMGHLGFAHVPS